MTASPHPSRLLRLFPALLAACLHLPGGASPSSVWRCDVAGQVTYTNQPCHKVLSASQAAVASQRRVDAEDARTDEQRRQAQTVAKSQERLVASLQQERRLREKASPRPAAATVIGLPPDPLARSGLRPTAEVSSKPKRTQAQSDRSAARTSPATGPASRRAPD
jgi:PAS domain-containing protein